MFSDIPSLKGTKIALWMSCHGARNYFKNGISGEMTSMAYESVKNGAQYSLGYVGEIYDTSQRSFTYNFFRALNNDMSIPEAVDQATQWVIDDNWWWFTYFGQEQDDFMNPILYKNGDLLNPNCGNGSYTSSENSSNSFKRFQLQENQYLFVDNTCTEQSAVPIKILNNYKFKKTSNSSYNPQYIFRTRYLGNTIMLGFSCNSETGSVTYYNLTSNQIINSTDFERMMGEPSNQIMSYINS